MKGKWKKKLFVLLSILFTLSAASVLFRLYQYRQADQIYENAQQLATNTVHESTPTPSPAPEQSPPAMETDPPDAAATPSPAPSETPVRDDPELESPLPALAALNLEALREVNDRVLGWIHIPDSPVDYTLIQVEDNNEYLYRSWDGTENKAGSIFLECKNNSDLSDFNTLIYGHRMGNGSMFGMLARYREQAYRDSHPYISLVTDEAVLRYEVFSVYEADVTDHTFRVIFRDEEEKQAALDHYVSSSVLASGPVPGTDDRILTLATCTGTGLYDTRWVVQAVLSETFPRT